MPFWIKRSRAGPGRQGDFGASRLVCRDDEGEALAPATLRAVGGTEGVGVTFLEEAFASAQANPKHRLHQKAAQAVLKALLPETGTDIKGQMRSTPSCEKPPAMPPVRGTSTT